MTSTKAITVQEGGTFADYDAIVVGLGFGGIYALRKLRDELGLTVRAFDRAGGVGGTWWWNRYPGALSDTESHVYRFSFDKELLQEGNWTTSYLRQPEILEYLDGVVDRFDLRRDIQLNTGVTAMHFDASRDVWEVTTDTGETFTARYVVTGLGLLSATNIPDYKGTDTFAGQIYHTGAWPAGVDLKGKRVGVLGTGSTGQQVIAAIAPEVAHLTVFQRSPQYSVPVGNRPVAPEQVAAVKADYDQIWKDVRNSAVAFGFTESTIPAMSVSEEERKAVFESAWERGGGFHFMFGTFGDIAVDEDANEAAASFVRGKIAQIVKDPETARKLTPHDLYAKRPLCNGGFYETFNRENVTLQDIKANPIAEVTPTGITTADGIHHELDVIIFATGFDAVDGNYTKIDIVGKNGESMKEHWQHGPTSYLGVTTNGFPNLFMILGPNGPFTNLPPSIEVQVEWIGDLINKTISSGSTSIESTKTVEDEWVALCKMISEMTLFPKVDSWIYGANTAGRPKTVLFYLAGLGAYRGVLREELSGGLKGFELTGAKVTVPV